MEGGNREAVCCVYFVIGTASALVPGRAAHYWATPPQTRTCTFNASGSSVSRFAKYWSEYHSFIYSLPQKLWDSSAIRNHFVDTYYVLFVTICVSCLRFYLTDLPLPYSGSQWVRFATYYRYYEKTTTSWYFIRVTLVSDGHFVPYYLKAMTGSLVFPGYPSCAYANVLRLRSDSCCRGLPRLCRGLTMTVERGPP